MNATKQIKKQLDAAVKRCQETYRKVDQYDKDDVQLLRRMMQLLTHVTGRDCLTRAEENALVAIYAENGNRELAADYIKFNRALRRLHELERAAGIED